MGVVMILMVVTMAYATALVWWATARPRRRVAAIERADASVEAVVRPLVARGVAVRCIEPVPSLKLARVRFADGTAVVVRGDTPGDVGVLVSVLRDHAVRAASCSTDAGGTHLVFGWSGGRRTLSVRVTGLDQPG
jgi:hypothetical protein